MPEHHVNITVQAEDGGPLAGAVVRADAADPQHPLNVLDALWSDPVRLGLWRTDQRGTATIAVAADGRPTTVAVLAPGYAPWLLTHDLRTSTDLQAILRPVVKRPATSP